MQIHTLLIAALRYSAQMFITTVICRWLNVQAWDFGTDGAFEPHCWGVDVVSEQFCWRQKHSSLSSTFSERRPLHRAAHIEAPTQLREDAVF